MVVLTFIVAFKVTGQCNSFTAIDGKLLERLARDAGFQSLPGVSRNGSGTKLFLIGRVAEHITLVKIISTNGVIYKRFATGRPVVDDNGNLISWVTNHHALVFASGEAIPIAFNNGAPATFEFSPGGGYFLLELARNSPGVPPDWIAAAQPTLCLTAGGTNITGYSPRWQGVFPTSGPVKPLFRLPNDFYPMKVFTRNNQIIVFGNKYTFRASAQPGTLQLDGEVAWGLVFSEDGSGYRLTSQLDLSRFSGVLDVDPATGMLLVRTKGEMFARWGLFNPETGKYESLGPAEAYGFFLDPGFAKYVKTK